MYHGKVCPTSGRRRSSDELVSKCSLAKVKISFFPRQLGNLTVSHSIIVYKTAASVVYCLFGLAIDKVQLSVKAEHGNGAAP
jgi:hypothetical protein